MAQKEPSSFRLIGSMTLAGVLSGTILVSVYLGTKPLIEKNRAAALERAVFKVLPGTVSFNAWALEGDTLALYEGESGPPPVGRTVYRGVDIDGALTGFAIPAEGPGYADTIKILYGFRPGPGNIVGMEVLESRETPGLGDKIITDVAFHQNFKALQVDPEITLVKKGEKTQPHEIEGLSGATISSKAVKTMLQKSMQEWRPRLKSPQEKEP